MSELKIENINKTNAVDAPANTSEIKEKAGDTLKDITKPIAEGTVEPIVKHVIVYLGNSAFTDAIGHKWYKNDEQTYSDKEYGGRNDLHFMVGYGEMKHTIVTI